MSEDVIVSTAKLLLIGILIIVVFSIIVIQQVWGNGSIEWIFKLATGGGTPPAPDALVLENAIECSYYRCANGCNSNQVKKVKYSASGVSFDCSDFCKQEWTDTKTIDGKICDGNSKNHPVTADVLTTKGEKLSKDKVDFAACFIEVDTCGTGFTIPKYVVVGKSSVKKDTETTMTCAVDPQLSVSGFSAAIINPDSYKIWTVNNFLVGGQTTYVCGT